MPKRVTQRFKSSSSAAHYPFDSIARYQALAGMPLRNVKSSEAARLSFLEAQCWSDAGTKQPAPAALHHHDPQYETPDGAPCSKGLVDRNRSALRQCDLNCSGVAPIVMNVGPSTLCCASTRKVLSPVRFNNLETVFDHCLLATDAAQKIKYRIIASAYVALRKSRGKNAGAHSRR